MAVNIPPELWLKIISYLTYEDVHFRLINANKFLHRLIGGFTIHRLPLALWEQVFTHLDYFTLLNVAASCRLFRGCVKYSKSNEIKAATFREQLLLKNPLPSDTKFKLHPAFKCLRIGGRPSRALLRINIRDLENPDVETASLRSLDIDNHPIMSENITSPPVQLYELDYGPSKTFGGGAGTFTHSQPATVRDVFLDAQRVTDDFCRGAYLTAVNTEYVKFNNSHTFSEYVALDCHRIVKVVEYGAITLKIELVADSLLETVYNNRWDDEEENERNAELLLLSMIGAYPYNHEV
ncbi:hypothetical protein TWF970_001307 [Orbilia oligospora]|uniref:F-box domain-containing protein n=1 Tax=Orbilia oligospora TaxID=2813651 RepID=A0A7C8RE92_ORBOL|nr:hypothetical protein TWF970_001307 [Orbilia oligospora]